MVQLIGRRNLQGPTSTNELRAVYAVGRELSSGLWGVRPSYLNTVLRSTFFTVHISKTRSGTPGALTRDMVPGGKVWHGGTVARWHGQPWQRPLTRP